MAETHLHRPAVTADGTPVTMLVNVADPEDVDGIDIATCDGVGLMRTEFLFGRRAACRTRRRSTAPIARCSNGQPASR